MPCCIRDAIRYYKGYEVKTVGDAFMVAWAEARLAVACALSIQLDLVLEEWPEVSMIENEKRRLVESQRAPKPPCAEPFPWPRLCPC